MSTLRAIKKLVLGETWILPAGVAAVLAAGAVLKAAAPDVWADAGGAILAAGVLAVLLASVVVSARGRRSP
jgi:hypothetical protein